MRITALVEGPDHVCCRYRVAAFRPALIEAGHELQIVPMPRSLWSRLRLGHLLDNSDLVILQRKLLPHWLLCLLRSASPRLFFDFDDAVFLRDSYSPKGLESPRRRRAFAAMCETVDTLIAGNAYLAQQAAQYTHPERVRVIPTCVDVGKYTPAVHTRRGKDVDLVWIGSSSTLQGIERIRPLLESIGQACPGIKLKIICDRFLTCRGLPVVPAVWSESTEATDLASADIGISSLPDDEWSRGKCGLKVLQYMAAGLPVVADRVGVQTDLIRHGETGFLVDSPEEWIEAIDLLARDPDLRREMGEAGRKRVWAEFSVQVGAHRWLESFALRGTSVLRDAVAPQDDRERLHGSLR